jgi:mono/diheme cytochrome c family protein
MIRLTRPAVLSLLSLVGASPTPVSAADEVRYNRDIRPILSNHCFKCHGPDLKKSGLDLQTRDTALKPAKSGEPAIVPGNAAASHLIQRVLAEDSDRMPPRGEPLKPQQIATLRAWIDQGAHYEEHWAYVRPVHHRMPVVANLERVRNPIDAFVLAALPAGVAPAAEADRATLLRRVSLDLTGLPPTPQEVNAFLHDQGRDAYERVVDRLLASPHYGEHQARSWLDLARYGDTNGYEKDERRTIWPYRDWVIDACNRDLPFDQFTIEQLAGDLLPNATPSQKIATGFHRNTMTNTEGGTDDEEFRIAAIVDRVNTTFEVWQGSTFGCAQCHNHKFDPFSQKEYYQIFAFFNSTTDRGRSLDPILNLPTAEEKARMAALQQQVDQWTKVSRSLALVGGISGQYLGEQRLAAPRQELAAIRPASTLVLQELPTPRTTQILLRGNHKNLGEKVMPGVPAKLNPLPPGAPLDRLTLARWLMDPANPLTSRVTMNRLWARTFGRGLVETGEDFGIQGELPSHPELLDWLATEFVEQKWSLKAMHRLLVTSATYRQSSHLTPELARRDPFNRLLARGPRFRLDAEAVRDNALAISGLLNPRMGGPSVFPTQPEGIWFNPYSGDRWTTSTNGDQYRRGLYTFWRRTAPYANFMAFDAPSREVSCERRPRTNTPLQALAVLNDKAFVEASAALARRVLREAPADEQSRLIYGFILCVARTPSHQEREVLARLYRDSLAKYQKDAKAAQAMVANGGPLLSGQDAAEVAAWTVVANVLLNLDETITQG